MFDIINGNINELVDFIFKMYLGHEKLINIIGRHGILDIFMDVSHTLEMAICVVNQLKNDSYC